MNRRETHLSDDELIDRLYGLGDAAHECPQCDRRLRAMEQRRVEIAATPVSGDFLAAQRRGIYSRLGQSPKLQLSWAPATVAALCLAVAGLFVLRTPAPVPAPSGVVSHAVSHSDAAAADAQLFSDVYAMEQSSEPRAAAPIHALIEEN
jgi:hypothetical protein